MKKPVGDVLVEECGVRGTEYWNACCAIRRGFTPGLQRDE